MYCIGEKYKLKLFLTVPNFISAGKRQQHDAIGLKFIDRVFSPLASWMNLLQDERVIVCIKVGQQRKASIMH